MYIPSGHPLVLLPLLLGLYIEFKLVFPLTWLSITLGGLATASLGVRPA